MLLDLTPKGWTTNDYQVIQDGTQVVNLHHSRFREQGDLVVDGQAYQIRKASPQGMHFQLWQQDNLIAQATKPTRWQSSFTLTRDGEQFIIRAHSSLGRRFTVFRNGQSIGSLAPKSIWSRSMVINIVDLPLTIAMFMAWLVLTHWQHDDATLSAAIITF